MIPPPRWWKELPDPWVWMLRLLPLAGCWRGEVSTWYMLPCTFSKSLGLKQRIYLIHLDTWSCPLSVTHIRLGFSDGLFHQHRESQQRNPPEPPCREGEVSQRPSRGSFKTGKEREIWQGVSAGVCGCCWCRWCWQEGHHGKPEVKWWRQHYHLDTRRLLQDGFANHRIVSTHPWEESCKQAPERLWECMRIVGIQWFTLCFVISFQKRASHGQVARVSRRELCSWYRSPAAVYLALVFQVSSHFSGELCTWSCSLAAFPSLISNTQFFARMALQAHWNTRNGRGCVFQTYTVFDLNHRWTTSTQELCVFRRCV